MATATIVFTDGLGAVDITIEFSDPGFNQLSMAHCAAAVAAERATAWLTTPAEKEAKDG